MAESSSFILSKENWWSNKTLFSFSSCAIFSSEHKFCLSNSSILSSNDYTVPISGSTGVVTGEVVSDSSGACPSQIEPASVWNSSSIIAASIFFYDVGVGSLLLGGFLLGASTVHKNMDGSAPKDNITDSLDIWKSAIIIIILYLVPEYWTHCCIQLNLFVMIIKT